MSVSGATLDCGVSICNRHSPPTTTNCSPDFVLLVDRQAAVGLIIALIPTKSRLRLKDSKLTSTCQFTTLIHLHGIPKQYLKPTERQEGEGLQYQSVSRP